MFEVKFEFYKDGTWIGGDDPAEEYATLDDALKDASTNTSMPYEGFESWRTFVYLVQTWEDSPTSRHFLAHYEGECKKGKPKGKAAKTQKTAPYSVTMTYEWEGSKRAFGETFGPNGFNVLPLNDRDQIDWAEVENIDAEELAEAVAAEMELNILVG